MLSAALASVRPAHAADDAVRIACPDQTTERAAELESRVRANLLTAELSATVLISCRPEHTEVRVDAASESVTVQLPTTSVDAFRDDVLRGVEEALQELLRRRARTNGAPHATEAGSTPTSTELSPTPQPASSRPPVVAPVPGAPAPPAARSTNEPAWTELSGAALGEVWAGRTALGGALGVARNTGPIWYGVRVAVLRPTAASADFDATEFHAAAELGVQPHFAAGVRVSLGVGPSVLFVAPHGSLTAPTGTAKSSLFLEAHLSRSFWFGRFSLLPHVGVRLFAGPRGIRIDNHERLALRGLVPALSLGLAYRFD